VTTAAAVPPADRAVGAYLVLAAGSTALYTLIFTLNIVYQTTVVDLSPFQLVLVGTVLEATVFLAEVPTGIVADLYSRKLSILIGLVLVGAGFVVEGAVPTFATVIIGQLLWGVGFTFTSGAVEAWITDEVGPEAVGAVFVRAARLEQLVSVASIPAAAALGLLAIQVPIVVGGVGFVVLAAVLARVMPERHFRPHASDRTTFGQIADQFRAGLRVARRARVARILILVSLVVGLSSEAFDRLWIKHLVDSFDFPRLFGTTSEVVWFAGIAMVGALLGFGVTTLIQKVSPETLTGHHPARLMATLAAVQVTTTLAFALAGAWWAAGAFWVTLAALWVRTVAGVLAAPVSSTWMNRSLEPSTRATVLSMESQTNAIGQVVGGPALGLLGSRVSIRAALVASGLIATPVIGFYAALRDVRPPAGATEAAPPPPAVPPGGPDETPPEPGEL